VTSALTPIRIADVDRTLRAALLAAFIAFAFVAGLGLFLTIEAGASVIAGAVAGALAGLLIWAAARRADSFHQDPPPPVEPGFPGPPERPDGTTPDEPDEPQTPSDQDDDH
jgi:hypothetical protein